MPTLIEYLVKLSVSLAVVWLFYQFVLRRLTFYNHNRWYLLGYSLLSFVIPFIDITPALHQNELADNNMVQWIPLLYNKSTGNSSLTIWNIVSLLIVIGMLVMLSRLIIQLISFRRMRKKAQLISKDDISLYQVDESIIPFSFGNAVFFNVNLHTTEELEKIIRHEFVHVKQRHSIDIIFSEILCLLNWYNPFAWMIRAAIRQNLEFVADSQVLENGVNKKQYQYLLLKVIGNDQFSIAQKFNFSSLKKRIAMMNKNKSAQLHLLRFLFLLPVLAVILVSFRKEIGDTLSGKNKQMEGMPSVITDTVPPPPPAKPTFATKNPMPDFLKRNPDVKEVEWVFKGENEFSAIQIIKKDGKTETYNLSNEAEREKVEKKYGSLPLPPPPPPVNSPLPDFVKSININAEYVEVWLKNQEVEKYNLLNPKEKEAFEKKYGKFPSPPLPPPPYSAEPLLSPPAYNIPAPPPPPPYSVELPEPPPAYNVPSPPPPPAVPKLPDYVKGFSLTNNKVIITLKNGEKEYYDLSKPDQKAKFEIKYGEFVSPPPPPPVPVVSGYEDRLSNISDDYEITDKKAVLHLKNGKTEVYDLTEASQKKKFEEKYGKIISPTDAVAPVNTVASPVNVSATTVIAPLPAGMNVLSGKVMIADKYGYTITGDEDVLVAITKNTTKEELEAFKKKMKEKGIDLTYDDMIYKNGKLIKLTGTMKSKDSNSNFVAVDFDTMILAMIREGEKTWFKVSVKDNKRVVI